MAKRDECRIGVVQNWRCFCDVLTRAFCCDADVATTTFLLCPFSLSDRQLVFDPNLLSAARVIDRVSIAALHSVCALLKTVPLTSVTALSSRLQRVSAVRTLSEDALVILPLDAPPFTVQLREPKLLPLYKNEVGCGSLPPALVTDLTRSETARITASGQLPERTDFQPRYSYRSFRVARFLSAETCAKLVTHLRDHVRWQSIEKEYPQQYRSSERILLQSDELADLIWKQLQHHLTSDDHNGVQPSGFGVSYGSKWVPVTINPLLRCSRYLASADGKFERHRDAGFCYNNDFRSVASLVIYLNDDFLGGTTSFWEDPDQPNTQTNQVMPNVGTAVYFNHNVEHQADALKQGTKYILRCDVMFHRCATESVDSKQTVANDPRYFLVRHLYRQCVVNAQKGHSTESTQAFCDALNTLAFTRRARNLRQELEAAGPYIRKVSCEQLFEYLLRYLSAKDISLSVQPLCKWLFHRSSNSELWLKLYRRQWPEIVGLEKLHQSDTSPALIDYQHLFRLRSVRDRKRYSLYLDIGSQYVKFGVQANGHLKRYVLPNVMVDAQEDMDAYWGYQTAENTLLLVSNLDEIIDSSRMDEAEPIFADSHFRKGFPNQEMMSARVHRILREIESVFQSLKCVQTVVWTCSEHAAVRFQEQVQYALNVYFRGNGPVTGIQYVHPATLAAYAAQHQLPTATALVVHYSKRHASATFVQDGHAVGETHNSQADSKGSREQSRQRAVRLLQWYRAARDETHGDKGSAWPSVYEQLLRAGSPALCNVLLREEQYQSEQEHASKNEQEALCFIAQHINTQRPANALLSGGGATPQFERFIKQKVHGEVVFGPPEYGDRVCDTIQGSRNFDLAFT